MNEFGVLERTGRWDTPWIRRSALGLVLLLDLAVCLFVGQQVVTYQAFPFDSDEANHANGGLALARELQQGDIGEAVEVIYRQNFYPPGMDWLKAGAFLLFGFTPLVARAFSVVNLFLAVLVLYGISLELGVNGALGGVLTAVLTLTMRPLLVNAGLVMMEIPGLLVSLLFLWAYLRALKAPSRRRFLLTSVLLAWAFFTKYTYGIVCAGTLGVMELSRLRPSLSGLRPVIRTRWLWLAGPFVLTLLGRPETFSSFFSYTRPLADDQPWLSTGNLLYYPTSLVNHDLPLPLFGLVTIAALAWAMSRWRDERLRLLLLYFLLGMGIVMVVNHPANPRFIVTFVPAVHLLTGALVGYLIEPGLSPNDLRQRLKLAAAVSVGLITVLSLPSLIARFQHLPSVMEVAMETEPGLHEVAGWIERQVGDGGDIYLVNYFDRLSPATLSWYLAARDPSGHERQIIGTIVEPATKTRTAVLRQDVLQSGAAYLVLLEGGPWGSPFWPEYTQALADRLTMVGRAQFEIEQFGADEWLNRHRLADGAWPQVKEESRYSLNLTAIVYRLVQP